MPVLRFKAERLESLTGLSVSELEELLFRLKCETEKVEDYIEVEINPDRPDMYIGEGIARAVLGLTGARKGWKRPEKSRTWGTVHSEAPPSRPFIAAALVRNVNVDDVYLEELIQFQEKLHDTLGRRRRKAAIGIHDASKLPSRKIRYVEMNVNEAVFKPLGWEREAPAREVLEATEQGRKYGSIALRGDRHPFLLSGDTIIAMPPVINSEYTRVEPGTRDLFIDVTGVDEYTVLKVLDVIVGGLLERPGARLETLLVAAPGRDPFETPRYEPAVNTLSAKWASSVLGVEVDAPRIAELLAFMGHNAEAEGDTVNVSSPPYRVDILGPIDLVEDVAIAIGYDELGYTKPTVSEAGVLLWETAAARLLRDLALGLGFTEVMQLTLTSPSLLDAVGFRERVEVLNPVQQEYSVLRPSMIPSVISVLAFNQHRRKPVKVFEIGPVIEPGNPPRDRITMGMGILDNEVGYEDIQAAVYAILRVIGVDFTPRRAEVPGLLPGRTAELIHAGKRLAVLGEVDPEVLERLGIKYPVAVAEIDVEVLAEWSSRIQGPRTQSPSKK